MRLKDTAVQGVIIIYLTYLLLVGTGTLVDAQTCPKQYHLYAKNESLSIIQSWTSSNKTNLAILSSTVLKEMARDHQPLLNDLLLPSSQHQEGIIKIRACTSLVSSSRWRQSSCQWEDFFIFLNPANFPTWFNSSSLRMIKTPLPGLVSGKQSSRCGFAKTFFGPCGEINFRYTYTSQISWQYCEWKINGPENSAIKLTFSSLSLFDGGPDCILDQLVVSDNHNRSSSPLGTFCGRREVFSVLSRGNIVTLTLKTARFMTGYGFNAFYETEEKDQLVEIMDTEYLKGLKGNFVFTRNLSGSMGTGQMEKSWQIRTLIGHTVQLNWELQSHGGRAVIAIYNGPTVASPLLHTTNKTSNGTLLSTGHILLIRLTTETPAMANLSGHFTALPISSQRVVALGEVGSRTQLSVESQRNDVEYLLWNVGTAPGLFLKISFTTFSFVGPTVLDCEHEGLVIYDGNSSSSSSSSSFGPYCGRGMDKDFLLHVDEKGKTTIISSSNQVTIVFYSFSSLMANTALATRVVIRIEVTDCIGVSPWSYGIAYEGMASGVTNSTAHRTGVDVLLTGSTCVSIQFPPPNRNTYHIWQVLIHTNATDIEPVVTVDTMVSDGSIPDCAITTSVGRLGSSYRVVFSAQCPWVAGGFMVLFNQTQPQAKCKEVTRDGRIASERFDVFRQAICGQIMVKNPTGYNLYLFAPVDLIDEHYFCMRVTCDTEEPCHPVELQFDIDEFEYRGHGRGQITLPGMIVWDNVPYFWTSTWSYAIFIGLYPHSDEDNIRFSYTLQKYDVTAPPVVASPEVCPKGSFLYAGHCYLCVADKEKSTREPLTWKQAEQHCQSLSGHLLTIRHLQELNYIKRMFSRNWKDVLMQNLNIVFIGLMSNEKVNTFSFIFCSF